MYFGALFWLRQGSPPVEPISEAPKTIVFWSRMRFPSMFWGGAGPGCAQTHRKVKFEGFEVVEISSEAFSFEEMGGTNKRSAPECAQTHRKMKILKRKTLEISILPAF